MADVESWQPPFSVSHPNIKNVKVNKSFAKHIKFGIIVTTLIRNRAEARTGDRFPLIFGFKLELIIEDVNGGCKHGERTGRKKHLQNPG